MCGMRTTAKRHARIGQAWGQQRTAVRLPDVSGFRTALALIIPGRLQREAGGELPVEDNGVFPDAVGLLQEDEDAPAGWTREACGRGGSVANLRHGHLDLAPVVADARPQHGSSLLEHARGQKVAVEEDGIVLDAVGALQQDE